MASFHRKLLVLGVRRPVFESSGVGLLAVSALCIAALGACATNYTPYESPTSGPLATIALFNAANTQRAELETFDDGKTCRGKQRIQFEGGGQMPAGSSRSLAVTAGQTFTLFVSLDTIETDEYAIELGMTTGAPSPVRNRSFSAIGCTARLSFDIEPEQNYQIEISEAVSSRSCTVRVLEVSDMGQLVPVETVQRTLRQPRNELGPFCEPLDK